MSFTPGTCAQSAAVSGATNKSVSCRTPAVSSLSGTCLTLADRIDVRDTPSAGHPESRLVGYVAACGSIRVTQRVLKPDGRPEDADLLVARDTAAQSAQVSRVCNPPGIWCPVEDTDLPLRMECTDRLLYIAELLSDIDFEMRIYVHPGSQKEKWKVNLSPCLQAPGLSR